MLRASIEWNGSEAGLEGATEGSKVGDGGIASGERLTKFAETAVAGDTAELATARDALREAVGSAGLVDAAAVVGNFQRMVRIADGTGIPLDGVVKALSDDFREDIGLEAFQTRRTTEPGAIARIGAPVLRRIALGVMRIAGRRTRAKQPTP